MKIQKYASINGLRALSIFLVLTHHSILQYGLHNIKWLDPVIKLLNDGQLGVNIFFVISGFLITSLMLQEEAKTRTVSLKNFYIRRTLRIFPAYYFLLLLYFIFQIAGYIHIPNQAWLTSLTYTKYFNWQADWYTRHAWSLSIEEHFYIFWPLVFLAGNKIRKFVAFSLIIIVPFFRIYHHYHAINWLNELTIFLRIDAIAMGCIFALYSETIINWMSPYWKKIFYFSMITLFFLRYFPDLANKVHLKFIFIPLGTTHGSIANILIAIIIMFSVFGPKGVWFKILNWKLVNYMGILSYSIYLWQELFLCNTGYWINKFPQNIICIFVASICSYHLIEKPFLRLKNRFQGSPTKTA